MARRSTLVLLSVLTLALSLTPASSAVIAGFGTHVTDTDADEVYSLDDTIMNSVVLIDGDSDGRPDTGEPILLLRSGTYIHTTAVRLAYPLEGRIGSQVLSGDADAGQSGTPLSGQFAYLDQDGDNAFTPGDFLFYDLSGGQQGKVSYGDVYLTGPRAGEIATSASTFNGQGLAALTASWAVDDRNDNGYGQDDRVYVDADDDGRITMADVRIGTDTPNLFGTWVPPDASRVTLPLATNNPPTTVVISDSDEDGKVDPGDPVYLSRSGTQVLAASVRLHKPVSGEVGTLTQAGDTDLRIPVTELAGTLSYAGTGTIDKDEPLIFDHAGDGSGTGDINELIISGQEAGSRINSASPHEGASLTSAPGNIAFLDVDGDGEFGLHDVLYLDADADNLVSAGDVQLSTWVEETITMSDPEANAGAGGDDGSDDGDTDSGSGDGGDDGSSDEPTGPSDSDGDGIEDSQDACPSYAAETSDGCPVDADGDGVPDDADACPDRAAVTDDGCPPDSDGDGVLDPDDACPEEAGERTDGCPEPAPADDGGNATDDGADEGTQGSPGPGLIAVLASLAGLAVAANRRR